MDFNQQNNDLLNNLKDLNDSPDEIIEQANKSIILCHHTLNLFKKEIIKNGFKSKTEEIEFFKEIKQIALIKLIYYSEIRSFEIQFPKSNKDTQQKYIKKKLSKLNRFFLYNMDFGQYIESNLSHFDEQYFTRDYFGNLPITSSKFYFQDPDFSTPRDMLLGKYNAYQLFIEYLQKKLHKTLNPDSYDLITDSKLKWTSSKRDLTELIYALHYNRVINNGKSDLNEIATTMQKVLHFDLGDFYKTYSEIKARKISRTKFLDDLSSGLLSHMDNSEK
jgi:hypothetical protein